METPLATAVLLQAALIAVLIPQCRTKKAVADKKKYGNAADASKLKKDTPEIGKSAGNAVNPNKSAPLGTPKEGEVGSKTSPANEKSKMGAAGKDAKNAKGSKMDSGKKKADDADNKSLKPEPDPPSDERTQSSKSYKPKHDDDTIRNVQSLKQEQEDSEG